MADHCDLLCLDLDAAEAVRATLDVEQTANAATSFRLLSDPTRLLIARALREQELCGCDLGWITSQSDKTVSHHLTRLRAAGLAESRREGRVVFTALTARGQALVALADEVPA